MQVIIAYLGCGCVVWYVKREFAQLAPVPGASCSRCGKPASGAKATEVRMVEAVG